MPDFSLCGSRNRWQTRHRNDVGCFRARCRRGTEQQVVVSDQRFRSSAAAGQPFPAVAYPTMRWSISSRRCPHCCAAACRCCARSKCVQEQTSNARLKVILQNVIERVEDGESIGDAFARHPKAFSEITVNLARAGGEGGFLEDAFDRVAQFIEHRADLKSRTIGALIYPIILPRLVRSSWLCCWSSSSPNLANYLASCGNGANCRWRPICC